ncbi:hypothetical protein EVAR_56752_1 [Eumeta japonica]|uniref:Secreted protein n=1 Tax=Eumeta variegata TaxID=151549 RepID=A0A4C1XNL7_EUMVA|nr:hypothetical protein EVAR_56752_1 [Eumeta japonica]
MLSVHLKLLSWALSGRALTLVQSTTCSSHSNYARGTPLRRSVGQLCRKGRVTERYTLTHASARRSPEGNKPFGWRNRYSVPSN